MAPKSRQTTSSRAYLDQGYEPSNQDIMCGRGGDLYFHPGNIAFRKILDRNKDRYFAARSKLEKSQIVVEILHVLREMGAKPVKFIRFDDHEQRWYTLNDEAAKQKIGQSIRAALIDQLDHKEQRGVVKVIGNAIQYIAEKTNKDKKGSLESDSASHSTQDSDIAFNALQWLPSIVGRTRNLTHPVSEITGRTKMLPIRRRISGEGVTSTIYETRYPSESPALGSSADWFTIGGLSLEECDLDAGMIDDIF